MKKKRIILVIIIIFLIAYFFTDSILFNRKEKDSNLKFRITYMLLDYDKTDSNAKMEDYYADDPETLFYSQTIEEVKEEKKYYTVTIKNINHEILKNVSDYAFTKNNIMAEIVDDVKFDKKKNKIFIPKKYFTNSKKIQTPLKMEIVSRIKKEKLKNLKVNVKTSKFLTKNKNVLINNNDVGIKFSIFKYKRARRISKDDIKIYLNGNNIPISSDYYSWDSISGTITFDEIDGIYFNQVNVKIRKIALFKQLFWFLSTDLVDAKTTYTNVGTWSDSNPNNISDSYMKENSNIPETKNTPYFYTADEGYFCGGNTGITVKNANKKKVTVNCTKTDGAANYFTSGSNIYYKAFKKAKKSAAKTTNPNTDYYLYDDFIVKVSKLEDKSFKATKDVEITNSDGNKETVTYKRTIDVDFKKAWAKLWCSHVTKKNDNNDSTGLDLSYAIDSISGDTLKIKIVKGGTTVGVQEAVGYFSFKKADASISVQKKTYSIGLTSAGISGSNASIEDIAFTLYTDQDSNGACSGDAIDTQYTGTTGVATFTGLDADDEYCIQEDYTEIDDESSISNKEYIRVNAISGSAYTSAKPTPGSPGSEPLAFGPSIKCKATTSGTTCDYYNTKVKYCYVVNKTDMNTAHDFKTIQLCVGQDCANNSGNRVALCGFEYNGAAGIDVTENDVTTNNNNEKYFGTLRDANGNVITHIPWSSAIPMTLNKDANGYYWSCPDCSTTSTVTEGKQVKKFQCLKVKKVDKNNPNTTLPGAKFRATCNGKTYDSNETGADGIATIYAGVQIEGSSNTCDVEEIQAPEGYGISDEDNPKTGLSTTVIDEATAVSYRGKTDAEVEALVTTWCGAGVYEKPYKNPAKLLNWYKTTEDDAVSAAGAKFTVKDKNSGNKIYHAANKVAQTGKLNGQDVTKNCYVFSKTAPAGVTDSDVFVSDENGEVCIRGVSGDTYIVTETQAAQYHTFSDKDDIEISALTSYQPMTSTNQFVNLPTVFEFDKSVVDTDGTQIGDDEITIVRNGQTVTTTLSKLTAEELSKINFNVYDSNGNKLSFKKVSDGVYEYSPNTIDQKGSGDNVQDLHLANSLDADTKKSKLIIYHLPWGANGTAASYSIKEADTSSCGIDTSGFGDYPTLTGDSTSTAPACGSGQASTGSCTGYYTPKGNTAHTFTISQCSNDSATAPTACASHANSNQNLENTPTEVKLTKSDLYEYENAADVQDKNRDADPDEEVKFENAKERSDFDRIDFKVKDSAGNYLNFIYLGNHGECVTDDENSYSIYRYVPGLQLPSSVDANIFNSTIGETTQTLHTCGGHMRVINLCRGNNFTFEEIKVPEDSVFVKEVKDGKNPETCFQIPCTGDQNPPKTTTTVIKDKPSTYEVQKRDSKYNYLIPDDTTTFRLYQCKKGEECHPADIEDDPNTTEDERLNAPNVRKVVKFYPAQILNLNEEASIDLKNHEGDISGNAMKVYVAMSDSDVDAGNQYITDINPYMGRLVFRYLQSGYNYVLVETRSPKNYMLPKGREAETRFNVVNDTVNVEAKDTPNVPTSLLIRKYNEDSTKLLAGAEFKIYKAQTKCNYNQDPWAQTGLTQVKLKTIRDGVYEARPETDTDTIRTCLDKEGALCSEIPTNTQTRLTDLEYSVGSSEALEEDTWADFENILYKSEENGTTKTEKVDLQEGEALIQYLEYGHCYVIEETKAPIGYSLPKKKKDRFTMVQIDDNEQYGHDTQKIFKNTPTPFTFYKYDEFNQLLDGAEFKLQKLNDDKKYEDIAVTEEEKETGLFYKYEGLAKEGDNTVIHTTGGKATVYYLPVGQYRIVETKAAPGKELTKNPNVATFFVDEAGNTFGNAIVVNKPETKKIIPKNSASAELIVNIQTGQVIMRYGAIILTIIGLIIGLMMLKKKTK